MRQVAKVCLALLLIPGVMFCQSSTGTRASTKKATKANPVATKLDELQKAIEAQQQQIQQLQDELKGRDSQVQQLQQQLTQTQATVSQTQQDLQAATTKSVPADQFDSVKKDVADLKDNSSGVALSLQDTQKKIKEATESPSAIHYKGITITPGGFLAAETVYRSHAMGADINTQLNGVNMPGAGQNGVSEFFASGRQSRVSLLAEGKLGEVKIGGFVEGDFLSAGLTSNNNQSNSYTFRQRQAWGQAAVNGWTVTGGQMWSLVAETRKGLDNRSEALPMTIDPQYTVGFSWARQFGFRVTKNVGKHFSVGGSVENPQTTFAARGNASNFALGGPGNGGGLYNSTANYSFNATPDFIVKAALEPGFGHYEIFGILSRFRDRVYPCVEPPAGSTVCTGGTIGVYNFSKNGGGVGGNARFTFAKKVEFGLHALYGNGVGRYGTSSLPDATVNPDGTLALLRSYQALGTLELHLKKLDVYLNGGEEYIGRRWNFDANNANPLNPVGYGSPLFNVHGCYIETVPGGGNGFTFGSLSGCSADTQSTIEGSMGYWYRIHQGPKGRLQFGMQYSYLTRNAWAGTNGADVLGNPLFSKPHGIENMFFTSFRYYLP